MNMIKNVINRNVDGYNGQLSSWLSYEVVLSYSFASYLKESTQIWKRVTQKSLKKSDTEEC